jgi:hypothetical protein
MNHVNQQQQQQPAQSAGSAIDEKQPMSWLDAEPDERQFMATEDELDDAQAYESVAYRVVGVTEYLDDDDEPAIRDTAAGTEPEKWIIRTICRNGREYDDRFLYATREDAELDAAQLHPELDAAQLRG